MSSEKILDACCGSKMFWFNKDNPAAVFMDNRELECVLCDGRTLNIHPDMVADFRSIPFEDEHFSLVVFDPPHLTQAGEGSWLAKKYGVLSPDWKKDIATGFRECLRVLKEDGVLIVKWNEEQVTIGEFVKAVGFRPLFGNRMKEKKTIWLDYMKGVDSIATLYDFEEGLNGQ